MTQKTCPSCCLYDSPLDAMSHGKNHCGRCGRIFGALKENELVEMEQHLKKIDHENDNWAGQVPRPSVLRRLIAEVRARRALGRDLHLAIEHSHRTDIAPEHVLDDIKEKS
jgi:ribosomal protein L34E